MKILVTGGAGFIGSNFINYMLRVHPDYEIVCVDNLTYAGNMENLSAAQKSERFTFHKADITDKEAIDSIFESEAPDCVINFAAESHVDRSIESPSVFLETNVIGVGVLLDMCLKHGGIRFHQISTDEVYGDLPLDRSDLFFTEESPIKTSSPYSASKASADLLVMAYFRTFGLPVTISRCSNNYGPYQHPEKLIPHIISRALHESKLPVYGDGLNVRDWIHVDDHCSAIDCIISNGVIGEIYNVGSHNEISNINLVRIILNELKKDESLISFVEDRKGHDRRYAISNTKICELGWRPEFEFESGIRNTIKWYLDNPEYIEEY